MNKDIQNILVNNLDHILLTWFILDEDNHIIHWSESTRKLFGYEQEEVLNQPAKMLLPGGVQEVNFSMLVSDLLHNDELINHRIQFQKKDGIILETEATVKHLKEDSHSYWLVTLNNITEIIGLQKLVYSKMDRLEKKLAFVDDDSFGKSTEDIYDAILVSVTAGQGLRFNRAFLFIVDDKKKELQGIQAIGPASPEEAGAIYQNFGLGPRTLIEAIELYQNSEGQKDDVVNRLVKDIQISLDDDEHILIQTLKNRLYAVIDDQTEGESVEWLRNHFGMDECIVVTLSWHGHPIGVIIADNQITHKNITNRDIQGLTSFAHIAGHAIETIELLNLLEENIVQVRSANKSLKESQAQLVEREKLAAVGVLMAQMAHEVRGPLAIIGGYARRVFNQLNEVDFHYDPLGRIVDTVKTLESVLRDILEKVHPEEEEECYSDIHKIINKVMNLLDQEIHSREISVNLNIQGDLPKIRIKEHHLFEIINNLVKNALEAIDKNGLLAISAISSENGVVINVKDSGTGIPPEKRKKLFTPFFTTKRTGTGLGLSIVKKLLDEYNGTINVFSAPNTGSTFTISFPL
ncbi:MAG: PAS domain S-box-containing protein [bacterium]|jgi:PAS domain S-box-containing protein